MADVSEDQSPANITKAKTMLAGWLEMAGGAVAAVTAATSPEQKKIAEDRLKEIEGWKAEFDKKYP